MDNNRTYLTPVLSMPWMYLSFMVQNYSTDMSILLNIESFKLLFGLNSLFALNIKIPEMAQHIPIWEGIPPPGLEWFHLLSALSALKYHNRTMSSKMTVVNCNAIACNCGGCWACKGLQMTKLQIKSTRQGNHCSNITKFQLYHYRVSRVLLTSVMVKLEFCNG